MKKRAFLCVILIAAMLLAFGCGAENENASGGDNGGAEGSFESAPIGSFESFDQSEKQEFTDPVNYEDEGISFKLPADHDGFMFKDMGYNCMLEVERYGYETEAYHMYDDEAPIVQKTVNGRTYEYQKIVDHYGMPDWWIYVIKIAFTDSPNQMEWSYYRILYNYYGHDYDDAQVEKFMSTIEFAWY